MNDGDRPDATGPDASSSDAEESPAAAFERFFGPSLFGPWANILLEHSPPRPGDRVLDLACATGIVARRAVALTGQAGRVTGVDLNPGMLEVARARADAEGVAIEWVEGDATSLDLPEASYDVVLCQQGLQFFQDPEAAVCEAHRVLVPGGRAAWSVWDDLHHHPVYSAILEAEARCLEASLEDLARPFMFGGRERMARLLEAGGLQGVEVTRRTETVEFDDPDRFVALTVFAGAAVVPEHSLHDPRERAALVETVTREADDVLSRYREGDRIRFPMPCYIGTGRREDGENGGGRQEGQRGRQGR